SMIQGLKNRGVEFPTVELFRAQDVSASTLTLNRAAAQNVLSKSVILNPDLQMAQSLASGETPSMTLILPSPSEKSASVELELTKVDIFADGFTVVTSSSGGQTVDYKGGARYAGVVKGCQGSMDSRSAPASELD